MRICFLDTAPFNYTPLTTAQAPLDGARSALCDLAREMASQHQVTLINRARRPAPQGPVRHLQLDSLDAGFWSDADFQAVVVLDDWETLLKLKQIPPQSLRFCLYHRLDPVSPELLQALANSQLTGLICVSYWQHQFLRDHARENRRLDLPQLTALFEQKIRVAPPAVAPAFSLKFPNPQRLLQNKVAPLTLACSGLPGPWLNVLFKMLPSLRARFPSLRLWFLPAPQSSAAAQATHARLLAQTSVGKNMAYKGLEGEESLAQALRQSHVMAYPGSQDESDILAVRQALACGCRVVCPDRGALAEVSRGWSRLVPLSGSAEPEGGFWLQYLDALSEELASWQDATGMAFQQLQQSWSIATALESAQAAAWWQTLFDEQQPSPHKLSPHSLTTGSPLSRLRWCFFDPSPQDYQVTSPEHQPLGSAPSAVCLLARELADRGHQVTLVNQTSQPGSFLGVKCLRQATLPKGFWERQHFDLIIALKDYPSLLELPGRRVLWNHHTPEDPEVVTLPAVQARLAAVVYLSAWQQAVFQDVFGLPRGQIIPHALSPFYPPLKQASQRSQSPVTLAYTSHPGRGLGLLLNLFPALRQRFPELGLRIFSSRPATEAHFQALYDQARQLEGVEVLGPMPQPELAANLSTTHILAYPGIHEATFCQAALEAMAAGCLIVSSNLASLPETTAGFARLVPFSPNAREFSLSYFAALCAAINAWQTEPERLLPKLQQQSQFAIETYHRQRQAEQWETLARQLLSEVPA